MTTSPLRSDAPTLSRLFRILCIASLGAWLLARASFGQEAPLAGTSPDGLRAGDPALQRAYQPDRGYRAKAGYRSMARYEPDRAYAAAARFAANARFEPTARFQARAALVERPTTAPAVPTNPSPSGSGGWFERQSQDHRARPEVLTTLETWSTLQEQGLRAVLDRLPSGSSPAAPTHADRSAAADGSTAATPTAETRAAAAARDARQALERLDAAIARAREASDSDRDRAIALREVGHARVLAARAADRASTLAARADGDPAVRSRVSPEDVARWLR